MIKECCGGIVRFGPKPKAGGLAYLCTCLPLLSDTDATDKYTNNAHQTSALETGDTALSYGEAYFPGRSLGAAVGNGFRLIRNDSNINRIVLRLGTHESTSKSTLMSASATLRVSRLRLIAQQLSRLNRLPQQ